jgi:hypothetical protein
MLKREQEERLLSEEDIVVYTKNFNSKSVIIETFEKAGHDIKKMILKIFLILIKRF